MAGSLGVVIRLGRGFNGIRVEGGEVIAGAAALDAHVARKAAEAGLDLTFLRTIPGTIGGAVRMNAGCYGSYVADVLTGVRLVTRDGEARELPAEALALRYRQSEHPGGRDHRRGTISRHRRASRGRCSNGWRRSWPAATRRSRRATEPPARPSATRPAFPRLGAPTTVTT